jgi:nicotinamide-nucleotide amidase
MGRDMSKSDKGDEDLSQLSAAVVEAARQRGLSLATAESCTAGALAHLLASATGAGDVLHGGFIAYTKANKTVALGVPADLLTQLSAVHPEIALLMAKGALARSPADIVVAVTGVAGPDADEDGNPVGLVYLAAIGRDGQAFQEEHRFSQDLTPAEICAAIMRRALLMFQRWIAAHASVGEPKSQR